jgi:hypothetical protein
MSSNILSSMSPIIRCFTQTNFQLHTILRLEKRPRQCFSFPNLYFARPWSCRRKPLSMFPVVQKAGIGWTNGGKFSKLISVLGRIEASCHVRSFNGQEIVCFSLHFTFQKKSYRGLVSFRRTKLFLCSYRRMICRENVMNEPELTNEFTNQFLSWKMWYCGRLSGQFPHFPGRSNQAQRCPTLSLIAVKEPIQPSADTFQFPVLPCLRTDFTNDLREVTEFWSVRSNSQPHHLSFRGSLDLCHADKAVEFEWNWTSKKLYQLVQCMEIVSSISDHTDQ